MTSLADLKPSDHSSGQSEQAYHGLSFIVPRGKGVNSGLPLNPPLWGHLSKLAQKHQVSSLGLGEVSAGPPLPLAGHLGSVVSMFRVLHYGNFQTHSNNQRIREPEVPHSGLSHFSVDYRAGAETPCICSHSHSPT